MNQNVYIFGMLMLLFSSISASGQTIFFEDFEDGFGKWTTDNGVWKVGEPATNRVTTCDFFGKQVVGNVASTAQVVNVDSRLISPPITLPPVHSGERIELKFQQWCSVREGDEGLIQIIVDGQTCGTWETVSRSITGPGSWSDYGLNLNDFAGSTIHLAFRFITYPRIWTSIGWCLNNVEVAKVSSATQKLKEFWNDSFESATIDPDRDSNELVKGSKAINGWVVTDGTINFVGSKWQASHCHNSVDLNGSSPGAISQTLSTVIDSGYQVIFDMAGDPEGFIFRKTLEVSAAGVSRQYVFNVAGHSTQNMGWQKMAFGFTAKDTLTTLTFASLTEGEHGPAIDNVRLMAAKPTSVGDTHEAVPKGFVLFQNYPNPFNPETEIRFELLKARRVRLAIYNTLGQEVRTLANRQYDAGAHSVLWNGRDVNGKSMPSGVYFYRLEAGNFVRTMKMILAK